MATSRQWPGSGVDEELELRVKGSQWTEVVKTALSDCSDQQRLWAIKMTMMYAPDSYVREFFQCIAQDQDSVFTHLLKKDQWTCIERVLQQDVGGAWRTRVIKEALNYSSEEDTATCILPHCTEEELELVLAHMVSQGMWQRATHSGMSVTQHIWSQVMSRGLWTAVSSLLQQDVGGEQHRWALEQASQLADDDSFVYFVLRWCDDEHLQFVLTHLVCRGLWRSVGRVLERGVSTAQHSWAVVQASQHADEDQFDLYMLHHCTGEHLQQVFTHLVSRGLWTPVHGGTHSITQQVLSRAVTQHLWKAVGRLLQQDIGCEQHRWAVQQASEHAHDLDFILWVLPQCHDEDLDCVLNHLVSRRLWRSVGEVLKRGASTTQRKWAVEQAYQHARHFELFDYVLPQCHDDELEHIMISLVSSKSWSSVGKLLNLGVSVAIHRWAVEEACKYAEDYKFLDHILPQCHDEHLPHVMPHLVTQCMWQSAGELLKQNIGTTQHRWAVEQASKSACDRDFAGYILAQCQDEDLQHVLTQLVSGGKWESVGGVLERGVSATMHRQAVVEASQRAEDDRFSGSILPHCSQDDTVAVFPHLVANRKWTCTKRILYSVCSNVLDTWMRTADSTKDDMLFWKLIHNCHLEVSVGLKLIRVVAPKNGISSDFSDFPIPGALFKLLMTSLLQTLCCVMCSDDTRYTGTTEHTMQCVSAIYTHVLDCIQDNTDSIQHTTKKWVELQTLKVVKNKRKWTAVFTEIADTHKPDPLFLLHFLQGLNLYITSRRGQNDDAILLMMFAVFPQFPQLQSTALRMMLHNKRWDVISQACLSHVWEHDRRQLFQAAVEQRQWDVVRQWADHTVHDDQRDWAMKEAFREKQWKVYLLLAGHGLTMQEHMHACYIVAKYGDWDTVLQMAERGGDITEVSNLLETWVTGNLRLKPKGDATVFLKRCEKLIRLRLRFEKNSTSRPRKNLECGMWGSVLFNILHKPTEQYFCQVLHKVIEDQEWHILMHLVRLGMNRAERDWLLPQMVRQQQWGVCRKLLEIGVDVQLCLEALPELMERNQWTLVARVMEYSVGDAVRRQVMHYAFQQREGVLFWHCLTSLESKEQLPVETRVKLFHQAISRDIWQAVKPLVEKDAPGIQCRDMAFLEAIELHLWDVVDFCQALGADINMEDENGETPLHREARKKEWKAVEEIVFRDGKPNLLDKDGVSVLNWLIDYQQWDMVKFVIKYGGNIHLPAKWIETHDQTHTPLQALIDQRQADVIHFTVLWCPEQKKGVNERGETVLHAICDSDQWDGMEDLMIRQVDPLAVTKTGQTALVYAVLNTQCPQRMVAECCRLGFSSHQPAMTGDQGSWLCDIIDTVVNMWHPFKRVKYFDHIYMQQSGIASPLVCAVLCDLPVVILMLFESGCSSHSDLSMVSSQLLKLTDLGAMEGRRLCDEVRDITQFMLAGNCMLQRYSQLMTVIEKNTAFMRRLAASPRTLLTSCRLLILRHFHFRDRKRHESLQELPLSVPLKNYLQFSDVCDPHYGEHVTLPPQSARGEKASAEQTSSDDSGAACYAKILSGDLDVDLATE